MLKGRKNTLKKRLRVLIDTTFLLPALGVEVEEEAEEAIPLFRKIGVYYLEVGVLEAIWKILKIVGLENFERIRIGLEAIRKTYNLAYPPAEAYVSAVEIYKRGHKDYIDALYYTTAKVLNLKFLTIDEEFIEFLKKKEYDIEDTVITPRELKIYLSK